MTDLEVGSWEGMGFGMAGLYTCLRRVTRRFDGVAWFSLVAVR